MGKNLKYRTFILTALYPAGRQPSARSSSRVSRSYFPGECRFLDGRIDDQAGDSSLSHLAVSVSNDLAKNRDLEKVAIGIVLELDIRVGFQCSYDPTAQTSVWQDLRCV